MNDKNKNKIIDPSLFELVHGWILKNTSSEGTRHDIFFYHPAWAKIKPNL